MATRNLLNYLGETITLTLPDSTTEDQWTEVTNFYARVPVVPTLAPLLKTINLSATDSVTTSSSQPAVVSYMTYKPEKGTYLAFFNGAINTNGASASGKFGFYVDDRVISETVRPISCNLQLLGGLVTISLNTIGVGTYTGTQVDLDGTQTIDVKFFSTNGGTIGFNERTMILLRVR